MAFLSNTILQIRRNWTPKCFDHSFLNIDARNLNSLNDAYSSFKPSKIVHLAAISSAEVANKNPTLAYDIQINSLRNVIDICKNHLGRTNQLVFMSSSTVYGDFKEKSVSEEIRPQPKGVYANGKYIGERMVREAKTLFGIDYTIIRPSALYGTRCISGRVSQKFVENAKFGLGTKHVWFPMITKFMMNGKISLTL